MNLKEKEEVKSWKMKYKEHVRVLEVKGHLEEQNEFFHIKDLVEDIFTSQFSTFSPIIQLSSEKKGISSQPSNSQTANFTTIILRPLDGPLCSALQR